LVDDRFRAPVAVADVRRKVVMFVRRSAKYLLEVSGKSFAMKHQANFGRMLAIMLRNRKLLSIENVSSPITDMLLNVYRIVSKLEH
jgi:hypothetical protein